jgi:hypothetical protein
MESHFMQRLLLVFRSCRELLGIQKVVLEAHATMGFEAATSSNFDRCSASLSPAGYCLGSGQYSKLVFMGKVYFDLVAKYLASGLV